jgi:seryl-tRNA synthetase
MTRISTKKFGAVAGGLLAIATTNAGVAQETAGDRYARTLAEAGLTARYNVQIEQQVNSQQQEIASLEQQIAALDTTAVDVQPLLQRMFDELVEFVANDVPFFKDERDQRIARIRELMASVDASPSEKFRRVMEAYQIEMEYGRTMSSYKQTLADGREAEMVRLGRVSLMYRTVEDGETGYWDKESKAFVADPDLASEIENALAIAKEERAADLIVVPVPAPQGGRS